MTDDDIRVKNLKIILDAQQKRIIALEKCNANYFVQINNKDRKLKQLGQTSDDLATCITAIQKHNASPWYMRLQRI